MKIYAFSDEASSSIDGQIAALKRNGLNGMEIRGVDGENISAISIDKAKEVLKKLKDNGLSVWSIGSPIGKIDIEKDDFNAHLDVLRHTLEVARTLECDNLRMFSFYIPKDHNPAEYKNEVIDRLGRMADIAKDTGVLLCHENEKGIYGDIAVRCAEVLDAVPSLKCVFDPANFIQCKQDIPEAWKLLGSRVYYMHIKDCLESGQVVPAGHGIGHLAEVLKDYLARGGEAMTIEPHLQIFSGFAGLEKDQKTEMPAWNYASSDEAFDTATNALKAIL